jgi:hypothetical protein
VAGLLRLRLCLYLAFSDDFDVWERDRCRNPASSTVGVKPQLYW